MLRNLGISFLLMGLLAAGYEGFRERSRVRTTAPSTTTSAETGGDVHSADWIGSIPPN